MINIINFSIFLKFLSINNHVKTMLINDEFYKINCQKSIKYALKIFYEISAILERDNLNVPTLFRPYSNLNFQEKTIDRTLYFIEDCIEFSNENLLVYKNYNLKFEVINARRIINKLYLNINKHALPMDQEKNWKTGIEFKSRNIKYLSEGKMREIIYWRTQEQWNHYIQKKSKINVKLSINDNYLKIYQTM